MKTVLCGLALLLASLPAAAQYPTKPVRMLVGFTPGGGVDIMARLMAARLTERWGKAVVVENRAGAAGNIATEIVAKSAPDGHTLLMAFSSPASTPAPAAGVSRSPPRAAPAPVVGGAPPAAPAKTLAELIDYARAHPGAIKFA